MMLLLWTAAFWYLGTLNGPFVAPRSVLPWLVSVVILLQTAGDVCRLTPPVWIRRAAVTLTLLFAIAVAWADYQWAAVYRERTGDFAVKYGRKTEPLYFVGHWGWQYYAEDAGLVPFDPRATPLAPGDLVIVPSNADAASQPALPAILSRSDVIGREQVYGSAWLPRTKARRSCIFLHADTAHGRIPWGWAPAEEPLEEFIVVRFRG
jgi:hypothetical protein